MPHYEKTVQSKRGRDRDRDRERERGRGHGASDDRSYLINFSR